MQVEQATTGLYTEIETEKSVYRVQHDDAEESGEDADNYTPEPTQNQC